MEGLRSAGADGEGPDAGWRDIDPRLPRLSGGKGAASPDCSAPGAKRYPTASRAPAIFGVFWDGDTLSELLDRNMIFKWNWAENVETVMLTAEGCASNNGTKATPAWSADILGDWREEVIWRTTDNKELRIYTTTIPTKHRFYTLMHDPQYR